MPVACLQLQFGLLLMLGMHAALCACSAHEQPSRPENDTDTDDHALLQTKTLVQTVANRTSSGSFSASIPGLETTVGNNKIKHALWRTKIVIWCAWPLLVVALGLQARFGNPARQTDTDSLTGIRGVLILFIFLYHGNLVWVNVVGAFFMLSGLVIRYSRIAVQASFTSVSDVGMFVLSKWLRILPFSLLCTCMPSFTSDARAFWFEWATNLMQLKFISMFRMFWCCFFSGHGGETWFVACILALYALYPFLELLVCLARRAGKEWAVYTLTGCFMVKLATALLIHWFWLVGAIDQEDGDWYTLVSTKVRLYCLPLTWIPDLMAGMVLPSLRQPTVESSQSQVLVTCADFIAIAGVLVMLVVPRTSSTFVNILLNVHGFAPLTALILWSLLPGKEQSLCKWFCSRYLCVQAGMISFAFYLCHNDIIECFVCHNDIDECFQDFSETKWARADLLAALICSIFMAWALFVVVEQHFTEPLRSKALRLFN